ncbi:MAG TPA: aminotransferase class I/II-fold pyridoxal phosphate-dependent enzyme [Gaiellaceae bacterium]|nr:aminotransferase class I/II-fold pyridoxal phosphate-dependent enzyme [Gaiellaceae bacterium]
MPPDVAAPAETDPLAAQLRAVQAAERASFHMPGHKGGRGAPALGVELLGSAAYEADVSELAGFDYLHDARTALAEAQARAARLFGADRTWFLVNGATVGNLAALCGAVRDGEAVLVSRSSHRSVYAGLVVAGARPVYLDPIRNEELDVFVGVDPAQVEAALVRDPGIRAVHVTSPSYYGFTLPLAEIAEVTARHGVPLIVDEAHGTHFALHPDFPAPALACGADVVVHSPHKTLGSLTQSSLLHLRGSRVDADRIGSALQMLQSSSPSALLLVSLSAAADEMSLHGTELWSRALELARSARERLAEAAGVRALGEELRSAAGIDDFDPTKLVVDVSALGVDGHEAARLLRERWELNPEFADLRRLVFSFSAGDDEATGAILVDALLELGQVATGAPAAPERLVSRWPASLPEQALTPRQGTDADWETVPTEQAAGRICAEMIVPYPPGIPLLVPGEVVSAEVLHALHQLADAGCRIVGPSDPDGLTLRCVRA